MRLEAKRRGGALEHKGRRQDMEVTTPRSEELKRIAYRGDTMAEPWLIRHGARA
ncbi:hypothetical protein Syun_017376 [Stephania yunnanensis]|uniref:Uncharacterized protein n=1 Tax=Stephania yunnanensis TaxID=152371 RepID=A0AAP0J6T4_9MAGN